MLISLSRNFIFIANLKTGSTSIESWFSDYAELKYIRSEWGKHRSLSFLEQNLEILTGRQKLSEFVSFAVVREPISWLMSMYNSHKSPKFSGTYLSTLGMNFDKFLDEWCALNQDMARPQADRLLNVRGDIGVDYIIRYDALNVGLRLVARELNIESPCLQWQNQSIDLSDTFNFDPLHLCKIKTIYEQDFGLYSENCVTGLLKYPANQIIAQNPEPAQDGSIGVRPLVAEDDVMWAFRFIFGRNPNSEELFIYSKLESREDIRRQLLRSVSRDTLNLNGCRECTFGPKELDWIPETSAEIEHTISREEVIFAFRYILGRDPESDATIDAHLACGTVSRLRSALFASTEFRASFAK